MASPHTETKSMTKIAFASLIGTTIEYYDYFIFGIAAALVFSKTFFPSLGPNAATIASMATIGVAFIARPLGSIIFGHYGDRLGRKKTLVMCLLIMGLGTFAIGFLPSAEAIGVAAPIALIALRFIQGIGLGGEWAGAVLLAGEHAPPSKRGYYTLFPQLGSPLGFILASVTFMIISATVTPQEFASFGWRIPFIGSALLVIVALYIRLTIEETPDFARLAATNSTARVPLLEVMRKQLREVLLAAGSITSAFSFNFMGVAYLTAYGTGTLKLPQTTVVAAGIFAGLCCLVAVGISSTLSDRFGRRAVIGTALSLGILWSLLLFPILEIATVWSFVVGTAITLIITGIAFGPTGAQISELFNARYRYTGSGFAFSIGGILGGSITPIIVAWLMPNLGSSAVGVYLAVLAVASLFCTLALRRSGELESGDLTTSQTAATRTLASKT